MKAAPDGAAPGTGASSAVSRRERQRKPRWRHWPRLQKQHEVMVEEARQAKRNAKKRAFHHRKRLRSDDGHHLGIKMIFSSDQERGGQKDKRKLSSMSFARQGI